MQHSGGQILELTRRCWRNSTEREHREDGCLYAGGCHLGYCRAYCEGFGRLDTIGCKEALLNIFPITWRFLEACVFLLRICIVGALSAEMSSKSTGYARTFGHRGNLYGVIPLSTEMLLQWNPCSNLQICHLAKENPVSAWRWISFLLLQAISNWWMDWTRRTISIAILQFSDIVSDSFGFC